MKLRYRIGLLALFLALAAATSLLESAAGLPEEFRGPGNLLFFARDLSLIFCVQAFVKAFGRGTATC